MEAEAKINLVHVTQYLVAGGLENFIIEFCKKLNKDRFNVSVLCLNGYDENYKKHLEQCHVAVDCIKKSHKYDLSFFLRAARYLKGKAADIVHIHGGCFFYGVIIGKVACIKNMIYTAHGMPITFSLQEKLEEYLSFSLSDKVIAVSAEIAEDYRRRVRTFRHKVETIINGIDATRFVPYDAPDIIAEQRASYGLPHDREIVGSVGRLDKVKNYPMLLRSVAELIHSYHRNVHLVMVGAGTEDADLKMLAAELGIGDRVSFLGMQYDLHRIYPLFDLFALSSVTEGTSLALLEAQSCGIPAVVTDVGGNSTIVQDGVSGLLCTSGDHCDMAAKLHRLLKDDAERFKMKQCARRVVLDKFDMGAMLKNYQQIYRELLAKEV